MDPWRDADEQDIALPPAWNVGGSTSAWRMPTKLEEEGDGDMGMPSWNTVNESPQKQTNFWSSSAPHVDEEQPWGPSPYEDLPIIPATQSSPSPSRSLSPEAASSSLPVSPARSASASPTHSSPLRPPSPDGFGTFETGLGVVSPSADNEPEAGTDPWAAPATFTAPVEEAGAEDAWGSAWQDKALKTETEEQVKSTPSAAEDEWERARERKAAQDRVIVRSAPLCLHYFTKFTTALATRALGEHIDAVQ